MSKPGRNESCPCGSGLKYKKCCLLTAPQPVPRAPVTAAQTFVAHELDRLREQAAARRASYRLIGALLFFSTAGGDAWLLELAEQDALRVAVDGRALDVSVNETPDTLEIGWTHRFDLRGGQFVTTSYLDGSPATFAGCPVFEIRDALEQIRRQYSREELASIRTDGN